MPGQPEDGDRKRAKDKTNAMKWQKVVVLGVAKKEGKEFLTPGQYEHVRNLICDLVAFCRPQECSHLDIKPFDEFFELRDKGSVLGKINVRVYFAFDSKSNEIVILSCNKKEQEGLASANIKIRLRNRWRLYCQGRLTKGLTQFERKSQEVDE